MITKTHKYVSFIVTLVLISFVLVSIEAHACTGIRIKTKDGNYIYARTLEFGSDEITYDLLFVPRNYSYVGETPTGNPGMSWKTKYAHIGFNPFGMNRVGEGLNEKGLACGAFFFPGYAKYQNITKADYSRTISCLDLSSWILSTCASVSEVREKLPKINVGGAVMPAWGYVPPLHYFVADETGDAIIIEHIDGKLNIHDNEVNVITNSPDYKWHVENLRNYINLSPFNSPAHEINGTSLAQLGNGSGAVGLPGDFTPPSRFVRAAFLADMVYEGKDVDEGIGIAFHILDQFDIPKGAVRNKQNGKISVEDTQWTSAADLTNRRYFYHTYSDRSVRMVDLNEFDLDAQNIKMLKNLEKPGTIKNVSDQLR
ncbi:MAG: choloylglycine hydrolase family protein [Candidatus Omnitrophica bacterium]|nr:choloylglycine hydrolase family protein [Candidatus Omnitrophota bacterium]